MITLDGFVENWTKQEHLDNYQIIVSFDEFIYIC